MDKANSKVGNRVQMRHPPPTFQLFMQQNVKSSAELLEQMRNFEKSASQMKQTPKNGRLIARMNAILQINKQILDRRGEKYA